MGASPADFNYRVALRRSRIGAAFVLAAGGATLILSAAIPLGWTAKLLAVSWVGAMWLDAYRVVRRGRAIVVRGERIDVRDGNRDWRSGCVRGGSFVASWLTIIRWRPERARLDRTIVILPDMLEPERFRELRVLLRWG